MRAGGAGVISGRSGAYPEVYAALVAALDAGDEEAAAGTSSSWTGSWPSGRASAASSTRCSCVAWAAPRPG